MRFAYILLGLCLTNLSNAQRLITPEAEFERIKSDMYAGSYTSYRVDLEVMLMKGEVSSTEYTFVEMHISKERGFMKTEDFDLYAEPNFSILIDHAEQELTISNMPKDAVISDKQMNMFQAMIKEPGMHAQVLNHPDYREILVTAPGISLTRYSMKYDPVSYQLKTIELLVDPNVELPVQYEGIRAVKARYSQIKITNASFPYSRAAFIEKTKSGYRGIGKLTHYQVDVQ